MSLLMNVRTRMCCRGGFATTIIALCAIMASSVVSNAVDIPAAGKSPAVDKIKQLGKLRVAVIVQPPYLLQDLKTNEYFGVSWEIAKQVADTLGVKVEPVASAWDVFIAGLQAGTFELSISPHYATPKRLQVVDFQNYTEGGTCYVVRKDNPKAKELKTYADIDREDLSIGTLTGSGAEQAIKTKYKKIKVNSVVPGPGMSYRIGDVQSGRIDIAPIDSPIAPLIVAEFPDLQLIPPQVSDCTKKPDIPFPVGIAFRKGDPAFVKLMADVVEPMRKSGKIDQFIEKYSTVEYLRQNKK